MKKVIEITDVSKLYRLGVVSTGTLSHDLKRWWAMNILKKEDPYLKVGQSNVRSEKGTSDYVWALKDINLEVEEGEVLGIIGKNGAGKSTLLKLLSRVTKPTTGLIKYKGRIASLLEVGTGFHPELTGRENIYMNGSIMGMTRAEIDRKLDEIIDFAGVERYIDTPTKRYSSGMTVRLGFSIAAHLEPDILVVDEVLAVGDAEFQKKAIGKMQDVSKGGGRTVLFVSHNMTAIESLCTKVVVLENGMSIFEGGVEDGIMKYFETTRDEGVTTIKDAIKRCHPDLMIHEILINDSDSNIVLIDEETAQINFKLRGVLKEKKRMALEIRILDFRENLLAFYSPGHLYGDLEVYDAGEFEINETFTFPKNTSKGEYFFTFSLSHPNVETFICVEKVIKLVSKGIITNTGFELNYKDRGFLILERINNKNI